MFQEQLPKTYITHHEFYKQQPSEGVYTLPQTTVLQNDT